MAQDRGRSVATGDPARPTKRRKPPSWLEDRPIREVGEDLLNFQESAQTLARQLVTTRVAGTSQSLTISLEGPWGSGKSSYSHLLIEQLKHLSDEHPPLDVSFNVWQSGATTLSPWGALVYRLGQKFYTDFHQRCLDCPETEGIRLGCPSYLAGDDRAKDRIILLDPENAELKDARLHWIEVAHRLSLAVPKKDWAPCLKLFGDAPSKVPGRHLSWRQGGFDAVLSLGQAGLSMASGGMGDAIKGTGQAASELFNKRLIEGPAWGTDTLEFVEQLDQLLEVLYPDAKTWRCIIAVDDITRLKPGEHREMLEALGYLRELRNALVLLSLDGWLVRELHTLGQEHGKPEHGKTPSVEPSDTAGRVAKNGTGQTAESTAPETSSPPPKIRRVTEPFLTRLVNLRLQIPQPRPGELGRMLGSYFEDLGLPSIWASAAVRHLLPHEVQTPRQIKRALVWLWLRLGQIEPRLAPSSFDDSLLRLLLDVYLFTEGQPLDFDLKQWESRRHLLMRLAVQPWDLRFWLDKDLYKSFATLREEKQTGKLSAGDRSWSTIEKLEDQTRSLTEHLRLLSVVAHIDKKQLGDCREIAQLEWNRWQETLYTLSGGLTAAITSRDDRALLNAWIHFVERTLSAPVISAMIELTSVARYFNLVKAVEDSPEVVLNRWFDYDGIILLATTPGIDDELRHLANSFLSQIERVRPSASVDIARS